MINTKGIKNENILAGLYNASKPQGMGFLQADSADMSNEEAKDLLKDQDYFDYLKGRIMKVRIVGDELEEALYDRDNGQGAARQVIDQLR